MSTAFQHNGFQGQAFQIGALSAGGTTIIEADGASAGTSSVAGVGAAVWAGVQASSATATSSAVGAAVWACVVASLGTTSAAADGEEILVVRARAQEFSPRYRRGPMVWIDEQGNEVELFFDEGGGRHIRMKPKVKKPYKPVRGIRFRRD